MKNLILSLAFVLMGSFAFANVSEVVLKEFPTYSIEMDLGVDCSANCTFSSCSGSGNCTCTCSWFTCTCKQNGDVLEIRNAIISINQEQYNNISEMAKVLKSLTDDSYASIAFNDLSTMMENLKVKDYESFETNRGNFLNSMNNLNDDSKSALNNFFEIIEAEERV